MAEEDLVDISLFAVRHGQTANNAARVLQGQTDCPLNERGREQARLAGERLKDVPFVVAFCSGLSRAMETASLIVQRNQAFSDPGLIRVEELIRERSFGVLEGKPLLDDPLVMRSMLEGCPEGGESESDVRIRADQFVKQLYPKLANLESGSPVLVVSHGGFLRNLMAHFQGTNKVQDFSKFKDAPRLSPNTGITQINLSLHKRTSKLVSGTVILLYCGRHLNN